MITATLSLKELAPKLGEVEARFGRVDFRPALKVASVLISASAKENFAGSHAPDGTPWAPLKRPRRNSKGGDRPLRDTGLLMASVGGGPGHAEEVSPFALVVGTRVRYSSFHQEGTRTIPARPFLGLNPTLVGKIERAFADHLEKTFG